MGNIGTKTEECAIYVQTKEPFYEAHQLVEGSVYLESYQVVSASHIELVVKGQEKVKFEEVKQGAPAGDKIAGKITEKSNIFEPYTVRLANIDGNLAVGQYQFPFSFQLPEFIPGSFTLKDSAKRIEGSIKYTLKAVLVKNGGPGIKHKAEVVVRDKPLKPNYSASGRSEQALCSFCLPKGNCRIDCIFENDFYQPGDEAHVVCKVDNSNGKVPINMFTLSLIQYLTLRSKKGIETKMRSLVAQKEYDGIEAGKNLTERPKILDLVLSEVQTNMVTGKDKASQAVQPSVHGTLVECRYEMEVAAVLEGSCMCCSNLPVAAIPLNISAKPSATWKSEVPSEFKPEVSDILHLILPAPSSVRIGVDMPAAPGMHVGMNAPGGLSPEQAIKMSVGPTIVRAEVGYSMQPMSPPIELTGSPFPTGTYASDEFRTHGEAKGNVLGAIIDLSPDKFEMKIEADAPILHEEVKVKATGVEMNDTNELPSIIVPATSVYVGQPEVKVVTAEVKAELNVAGPSASVEMKAPALAGEAKVEAAAAGVKINVDESEKAGSEFIKAEAPKIEESIIVDAKVSGPEGASVEVKAGLDNPALSLEANIEAPKEGK